MKQPTNEIPPVVVLKQITGKGKKRTMENTRTLLFNFQHLLKASMEGLPASTKNSEELEWRWIMNASVVNAAIIGYVLKELDIRYITAVPEFPDIKNPTYDVDSYTLMGYQVWCGPSEHERLRKVTEIMQPYFVI